MAYKSMLESTATVDSDDMAQAVEDSKMTGKSRRRLLERRWYDNNFFDDGFHFRYYSRSSNKVVDLSERSTIYTPQRSIPKASHQIRGIMNLLMSSDPTPTVYPDYVNPKMYPNPQQLKAIKDKNEKEAQLRGKWLLNEWKRDPGDGETVLDKITLMMLLTMKHSVSFMQVWPDEHDEEIRTQVYDAFDIYILGNLTSIYDAPFIVKAVPTLVAAIKANPLFDEEKTALITPDNKKASSEIKEAYMQSRFGRDTTSDQSATLILNEAFFKEHISSANRSRIQAQEDGDKILKGKEDGDPIIRQTFVAGGMTLFDHYTNLSEYPFIDFRMEPGPIYQIPMIERFMPANKSLDSVVSRIERYTHTMTVGTWLKRRGENFQPTNIAGGLVLEYDAVAPEQMPLVPLPPSIFTFVEMLNQTIEEQGVTTTTVGKMPNGIQANAAIESLKESEYANLIVPTRRLNSMIKRLARKYLEIAHEHIVSPQEVTIKDKGEVQSFKVIGKRAARERKKLKVETPYDVITLSKDAIVDIEIEQGMAYTKQGQQAVIQKVMDSMIQLLQAQAIPPQAIQVVAQKYLETYQFGATQDFMDTIDDAFKNGGPDLTQNQVMMMKIAVLEALKEAGEIGPKGDQTKVDAAALGALKALKDAGVATKQPVKESVSINYKDAPEPIKRQMEADAGFTPSPAPSPTYTDNAIKGAKVAAEIQRSQQAQLQKQQNGGGE